MALSTYINLPFISAIFIAYYNVENNTYARNNIKTSHTYNQTENIIYFESYYFLRVLSFLQLYFARGPVIGRFCYRQPISIFGGPCLPEVAAAHRSADW